MVPKVLVRVVQISRTDDEGPVIGLRAGSGLIPPRLKHFMNVVSARCHGEDIIAAGIGSGTVDYRCTSRVRTQQYCPARQAFSG
ncbi:MAG TPA: hypothetical protein PKJ91_04900, partial [Methanoregulaceae archaeon]|nr:hypothetical protein [Methanoregulaceae archaeon]